MSLLEILALLAVLALVCIALTLGLRRALPLPRWQERLARRRLDFHEEAWTLVLAEARRINDSPGAHFPEKVNGRLDALAFIIGPDGMAALLAYRRAAYARADLPLGDEIDVQALADVAELAASMFKPAARMAPAEAPKADRAEQRWPEKTILEPVHSPTPSETEKRKETMITLD